MFWTSFPWLRWIKARAYIFLKLLYKNEGEGSNFRHLTSKKFKSKNINSLCLKFFKFVSIRLVKMVKENKLCLVFVKYVIGFENIRHFVPVPSPPSKWFILRTFILNLPETSKHRNDVPNSIKSILKPKYSQQTIIKSVAV